MNTWLKLVLHPGFFSLVNIFFRICIPVLMAIVIVIFAGFQYEKEPTYKPPSYDYIIVDGQLERSYTLPSTDILFIGDSSCLMGIDVKLLNRMLQGIKSENLCNIGYVGPEGYAQMLINYFTSGHIAKNIIVMLHGVQMKRHPSWEGWAKYIISNKKSLHINRSFISGAQLKIMEIFGGNVFIPLPGLYGKYYGSETNFMRHVKNSTIIDPGGGRCDDSAVGTLFHYEINEAFQIALMRMRKVLSLFKSRVYLIVSPVPNPQTNKSTQEERENAIIKVAKILGIPDQRIIDMPGSLPCNLFSSTTHLAAHGRLLYTEMLAKKFLL
jgi:hypothetical protein